MVSVGPLLSSSSSSTPQGRGIASFFTPVSHTLSENLSEPPIVHALSARTQVVSPTNVKEQIESARQCASELAHDDNYEEAAAKESEATIETYI